MVHDKTAEITQCKKIHCVTTNKNIARFQVLMVASVKMIAFWDIAPCSLVVVDQRFSGAQCLHHQGNDGGSTHL
jgi:hypothetical protein